MNFSKNAENLLNQYQVEEKLDWKSLLAAGLIAAPGAAKDLPQKEQPAIVQQANKPYSNEQFIFDAKNMLRQREGSNNFNAVKKLHGKEGDPTIGWGHSLKHTNQSKAIFNRLMPEVEFEQIFDKQAPLVLSLPQAEKLLNYDVNQRFAQINRIFKNFPSYDKDTKLALFDLLFRGDMTTNVSQNLKAGEKQKAIEHLENSIKNADKGVKIRVNDSINQLKKSSFFNKPEVQPAKTNKPPAKVQKKTVAKR